MYVFAQIQQGGGARSALADTPDRVVVCPQAVDNFVLENCERLTLPTAVYRSPIPLINYLSFKL